MSVGPPAEISAPPSDTGLDITNSGSSSHQPFKFTLVALVTPNDLTVALATLVGCEFVSKTNSTSIINASPLAKSVSPLTICMSIGSSTSV